MRDVPTKKRKDGQEEDRGRERERKRQIEKVRERREI